MPKNSPLREHPYWRAVLDATEDLIFIKDKNSIIVDANEAFFALHEGGAKSVIGQTTFDSYSEEEQERFIAKDEASFIAGHERSDVGLHSPKTGELLYYSVQKTRFEFEGNIYLLCVGRDITEAKKYALAMDDVAAITSASKPMHEKMNKLLEIGNTYFRTKHGFVTKSENSECEVHFAHSNGVAPGAIFPHENTFCGRVLKRERLVHEYDTEGTVFIDGCKVGLACYIGIPIYNGEKLYGTLGFSSDKKRRKAFSDHELKFVELLRERVSFYIQEMEREKELQKSQEMFQQALEGAAHGMAIVDLNGRWLKVNKSLCQMFGYEEEEFLDTDFQQITYSEDLDLDLKLVNDCITGKRDKYSMEKRYLRKGGEVIWGHLSVAIVRDDTGNPMFFISQIQDINARHQYETQMIEMTAQLHAILDTAEDGIITVDGFGNIKSFNRAAERMFGFKAVEAIGESVMTMLIPKDAKYMAERIQAYFDTGEKEMIGTTRDVTGLSKNGTHVPMEVTLSEIYNRGQDNALYSAILRDVSLRIEYEKNLERYNLELKRSNEELENFARVASHDLREPLRGIYNFSQFMKEDYEDELDDAGMNRLDSIMKMTKRMEGILSGLFDYAKIGRMEDSIKLLDLEEVVWNIRLDNQRSMIENNASIKFEGQKEITSYAVLMDLVLRNLITNGLKYNLNETPEVVVKHKEEVGVHLITVSDNGVGIPEEHIETAFQPFKRLQSRDSEFGEGSGMGLAFVQKAVANMGGYVKVSSTVGEGTTFTLCLPQTPIGTDGAENVCWLGAPR